MAWLIPLIFKAAAAYQAAKTAGTVIDYATTDQEKEGRELGTMAAEKVYKPALKNLQKQKNKIIAEEKTGNSKCTAGVYGIIDDRICIPRQGLVQSCHAS